MKIETETSKSLTWNKTSIFDKTWKQLFDTSLKIKLSEEL